ncbi:hypothetical protein Tmath_0471 [Thermoanaerobacter mathranii subsp. mathranii str. A3]|uniref:Uncharacterized protein n=2 Tax=Thermoanaerobacter TaxID=1754 RepID=A0A097AP15_THEKI|nr:MULTISPECIES: hypothetical protein [Thermoanaerobacter]ADH60235.1 hypothetical protein Tmath_0471 [Thermoanaerobacter mathranii subsp. mathranii str. A3]AIS51579.1 hypothetical protein TKV_c03750 [Thermoanaerobacter kivui]
MDVNLRDGIKFENLIYFEKEVVNPISIQQEVRKLIDRLKDGGIFYKNRLITKVIEKDITKKTVTMRIMIEVEISEGSGIYNFLKNYPQYRYLEDFSIGKSYSISISNDVEEFKNAISLLISKIDSDVKDINNYDLSKNNIIEIARIDYDGNVIGFDLFLEIDGGEIKWE